MAERRDLRMLVNTLQHWDGHLILRWLHTEVPDMQPHVDGSQCTTVSLTIFNCQSALTYLGMYKTTYVYTIYTYLPKVHTDTKHI